MSRFPSSQAVAKCMALLLKEKETPDFNAEVVLASIKWEAELLLALEEFRTAGGFVGIQDELRLSIQAERRADRRAENLGVPKAPTIALLDVPCHWSLLHDKIDVKTWLQTVSDSTVVVRSGEPTLATERATLRIGILLAVKKTIREAVMADLDKDQEARYREFADVQYRLARGERRTLDQVLHP